MKGGLRERSLVGDFSDFDVTVIDINTGVLLFFVIGLFGFWTVSDSAGDGSK